MEAKSILEEIGEGVQLESDTAGEDLTPAKGFNMDLGFMTAKTGEGSINDYIDHPLNFSHTNGMAQMIRGLTGLLGSLDLAIIDILVGLLQVSKDRKVNTVVN